MKNRVIKDTGILAAALFLAASAFGCSRRQAGDSAVLAVSDAAEGSHWEQDYVVSHVNAGLANILVSPADGDIFNSQEGRDASGGREEGAEVAPEALGVQEPGAEAAPGALGVQEPGAEAAPEALDMQAPEEEVPQDAGETRDEAGGGEMLPLPADAFGRTDESQLSPRQQAALDAGYGKVVMWDGSYVVMVHDGEDGWALIEEYLDSLGLKGTGGGGGYINASEDQYMYYIDKVGPCSDDADSDVVWEE